jgi:hypothetical protein
MKIKNCSNIPSDNVEGRDRFLLEDGVDCVLPLAVLSVVVVFGGMVSVICSVVMTYGGVVSLVWSVVMTSA